MLKQQLGNSFFKENFGKKYLYKSNIINNYKDIMNLDILNRMLSIKNIWNSKNFIMMLDKKIINYLEFSSQNLDITGNNLRPDINKVQQLISKGASVILNDVEQHNPELSTLANLFQTISHGRCQGNLYFSMESHQAFGPHCDDHDVFAVHFEGEKVWNIYENVEKNPINHPAFKHSEAERIKKAGRMIDQVTLKPGDLLYLPRGQYHDALASQNGALHIAFGLVYFKPIDLMSIIYEKFVLNEFMREDIKADSSYEEIKNTLIKFSQEMNKIINCSETADILATSLNNWPLNIDSYNLKKIIEDGRSYFISKSVGLENKGNKLYLTNGKDKVVVPKNFVALVVYIMKKESFSYKILKSEFNTMSDKIIKDCIQSLMTMKVIN